VAVSEPSFILIIIHLLQPGKGHFSCSIWSPNSWRILGSLH
jgi:hypothetical protein